MALNICLLFSQVAIWDFSTNYERAYSTLSSGYKQGTFNMLFKLLILFLFQFIIFLLWRIIIYFTILAIFDFLYLVGLIVCDLVCRRDWIIWRMENVSSDCAWDFVRPCTPLMNVLEISSLNMIGTLFGQAHLGVLNFLR